MTCVHKQVIHFLNLCHILISCTIVGKKITHKVQLHLDCFVWMNTYISVVYICCIRNVACCEATFVPLLPVLQGDYA